MASWLDKLRKRGFVGPRYEGLTGKLRLAWQEFVRHTEVVLAASPESIRAAAARHPDTTLRIVSNWAEFQPLKSAVDADYYEGYTDSWEEIFAWGEVLALAIRGGRVAGFGWVQEGKPQGVGCHYAQILPGEFRILRVGVLPSFRRQGVNIAFYRLLLEHLLERGAKRVYIDCNKDNVPSLKAQIRAGFQPIGEIEVSGRLLGKQTVRWKQKVDFSQIASEGPATETDVPRATK